MVRPNGSKMTRPDTVATCAGAVPAWGETAASFLVCRARLRPSVNSTVRMWLTPLAGCGPSVSIWLVCAHRPGGGRGVGWVERRIAEVDGGVDGALLVGPGHMNEAAEVVVAVGNDLGVLVGGRCDLAEPEVVGRGREVAEAVGDLLHVDVDSGVVIVGQAVALAVEVGWAGDGGELALAALGHV